MQPTEGLLPLVAAWLPQQRWFGGKGRPIAGTDLRSIGSLGQTLLCVATVRYADGESEAYQVPLVLREAPSEALDHASLGSIEVDGATRWVYDALHDKDVTGGWLAGIREESAHEAVSFHRTAEPQEIPVDEPSLVLTGEQSNTSLVYSDVAILKVFRRLAPGVNPDIEILHVLSERGAANIARLFGYVTAEIDGEEYALAMLQEFLTTATDGWDLAKISVRDLMAEGDLHAEEAGGDFAGEAERLGSAVATIHSDLALAFGTTPAGSENLRGRADDMRARLDAAAEVVPQLADLAPALHTLFDAFAGVVSNLAVQRIHGDLHLAQALRTVRRWVIIDFEGEPAAGLELRRRPDSPLRDIAGMLRSFDYAARHRLLETGVDPAANPQLAYRADEWATRNRTAFLDGYSAAAAEIGGINPRTYPIALRAFEADKAVYEAVYEARHRPNWLPIPLASLVRLTEAHPEAAES